MRNVVIKASLALLLALAVTDAWGIVILYKLTGRDGAVTYVDAVPKGFAGNVEKLVIDPGEHSVRLADRLENEQVIRRRAPADPREAKVAAAQARLEQAKQALESAQASSTPEDWIYMGPGRRAPRPEYEARLNQLEQQVRAAEESLRVAERGW